MADPFAHLLDSFKKNDTSNNNANKLRQENKLNESNSNNKQNVSSVNQLNTFSHNKIMEPLIPSNSLFVSNVINPIEDIGNSKNNKDDDWDKAYDIFNSVNDNTTTTTTTTATTPLSPPPPQPTSNNNNTPTIDDNPACSSFETAPIVDEVKDMEIAKIMSLGYSIDKSLQFYENDLDYDTLLLKQKYDKTNERIINNDLFLNEQNESFTNTLTNMFNKSKKFVQSLNLTDLNAKFDNNRHKGEFNGLNNYYANNNTSPSDSFIKEDLENLSLTNDLLSPSPPLLIQEPKNDEQISENNQVLLDWDTPITDQAPNNGTPTNLLSIKPQITDIEFISYKEFKDNATNLFKNGHYPDALEQYTKSLNTLPHNHPLRLIAISNIMFCQLKIGEYNNIIKLLDMCEKLWPNEDINNSNSSTEKQNWDQIIPNSEPPRTFKDIWIKIMLRCAESYEHLENFDNALNIYKQLLTKNVTNKKVLDGKRRCEKVLYPEKFRFTSNKSNLEVSPVSSSTINESTKSILNNNNKASSPPLPKHTENVERIKKINDKLQEETILKEKLYDQVNLKIDQWKSDKPTDIRHLLSNLQQVVTWTSWTPVPSTDLVMPKKVKLTYLKAASRTHPDKVPHSLDLENKMIAENVFSTLSKAWELFKEENNI